MHRRKVNRNKRIYELWQNGLKQAEIARIYGISRERVRQLIELEARNGNH
jgi:DNA-binding CsgD family transcriptional regulator